MRKSLVVLPEVVISLSQGKMQRHGLAAKKRINIFHLAFKTRQTGIAQPHLLDLRHVDVRRKLFRVDCHRLLKARLRRIQLTKLHLQLAQAQMSTEQFSIN